VINNHILLLVYILCGCNVRSTSKANISSTIAKQNNLMDIDTDKVKISTTNATLNNQMVYVY
jgi:hypothetical protein